MRLPALNSHTYPGLVGFVAQACRLLLDLLQLGGCVGSGFVKRVGQRCGRP